ncbi:MAG: tetratricopeptide repeat protein [Planctomycetota bacterium]
MNRITIIAAFFALVFFGGQCALAQSGYNLFQKGLIQERVKGDLDEAIKVYERIIVKFPKNRPLVAKALLHIGLCYEKLGKQEAQKAYQRLIKEYTDQPEPVAQARARLAALRTDPSGMTFRRVWTYHGLHVDIDGTVSPDGRYLPFEDEVTGDLVVRDLVTGENRRLTHNKIPKEPGQVSAEQISPDSTQVAYSWWRKQDRSTDFRLIGLDGSQPRVIYRPEEVSRIVPKGWSPDGKHILVHLGRNGTYQIALISVADGSLRVLKSLGRMDRDSHLFLSPDGRYIAYDFRQKDGSLLEDISVLAVDGSRDIPLVAHPADDDVLGWTPDGKSILFRSDRTGADGLWAIGVHDGKPQGSSQLVNKDLPPFKGLGITRTGAFYYTTSEVADMKDIYIAAFDPATGKVLGPPKPVPARFVGNNVSPAWSPDGEYLAYYRLSGGGDRGIMVIRSLETGEERELSPPIAGPSGWFANAPMRWSPDGHSILRIGWHESKNGIYLVDVETGNFTPIVEVPRGTRISHALWSPDGKAIFYRCWDGKNVNQLLVRNLENDKETELLRREGSPSISRGFALSPDGWQLAFGSPWFPGKGVTALHVIPTAGGELRELLREQDSEDLTIRGMGLEWTPDGRYVLFFRADGGKREYWRVAAEGGEPERLELGVMNAVELRIAPEGRRVAFTARKKTKMDEVWVMENFLPESKAGE